TAKVYADDGLMTADLRLANEVEQIFDFFKQNYRHYNYEHLVVSPFFMRNIFLEHIERETELAKKGKKGWMVLKMNSLIDPGMMSKLYKAAKAGVKIDLIVRGIFGLKLDHLKLRENVTAISIVDKYLEHSRIFLFGNNGDEKMYISSADWMPRNLNRRVEVACPVYDKTIKYELMEMLKIQLRDNTKARILDPLLLNSYNKRNTEATYRAQEDYYNFIKRKHHIVMKIYHNPRCAKSRAGLKYLEEKGFDLEIKKYLAEGISEDELRDVIEKTGKKPFDFVRIQEKEYKENYKGKDLSDEEWIKVLAENPKLLQRPLVENGDKAVLANPPEEVEKII
ncbi:MAG: hypothetical protein K9G70_15835, partial [Prolixibacteraceae bacterium]|nr:hypothetical protein [Prolixibacteraceae bacterium]